MVQDEEFLEFYEFLHILSDAELGSRRQNESSDNTICA